MTITASTYGEMTVRLAAALVLCGAIGVQRAAAGKAAGVRTHVLVGLGAALMTLVSAYAFPDWAAGSRDPTRLAAQIVSGIGFIGGGAILKEGVSVRGLTTAASLWAVAGVGIACGSGLVPLAAIAAAMMLVTLVWAGRMELGIPEQHRTIWMLSCSLNDTASLHAIFSVLREVCAFVHLVGFESKDDSPAARLTFELSTPRRFDIVGMTGRLAALGARDPQWKADSFGEELV